MSTGFNFKSPAALAPITRSLPVLWRFKSQTLTFPLQLWKSELACSYNIRLSHLHLKICHLVWSPSLIIFCNLQQLLYQHLLHHLELLCYWSWLLPLSLMNHSLPASNSLLQLPYLSHPTKNWRELNQGQLGPCSGSGFGFRKCCGWFGLLSKSLKCSLCQAVRLIFYLII